MALGSENCKRLEIPFGSTFIPGLFVKAHDVSGPTPLVLYVNGLDSCKELLYWSGLPGALARRGISSLSIDQPGTGETLRINGLPATYATEQWASPVFDWLGAARRCRRRPYRHGRNFAGRSFRRPRSRQGAALRVRGGLGRKSQLGRSAAETTQARG